MTDNEEKTLVDFKVYLKANMSLYQQVMRLIEKLEARHFQTGISDILVKDKSMIDLEACITTTMRIESNLLEQIAKIKKPPTAREALNLLMYADMLEYMHTRRKPERLKKKNQPKGKGKKP